MQVVKIKEMRVHICIFSVDYKTVVLTRRFGRVLIKMVENSIRVIFIYFYGGWTVVILVLIVIFRGAIGAAAVWRKYKFAHRIFLIRILSHNFLLVWCILAVHSKTVEFSLTRWILLSVCLVSYISVMISNNLKHVKLHVKFIILHVVLMRTSRIWISGLTFWKTEEILVFRIKHLKHEVLFIFVPVFPFKQLLEAIKFNF